MKIIAPEDLVKYKCILALPGYKVWENTNTFHVMVTHLRGRTKHPERIVVVAEGTYPGLAEDPPLTIPAGMFREIVKKLGKIQPNWADNLGAMPEPPQPPRMGRAVEGARIVNNANAAIDPMARMETVIRRFREGNEAPAPVAAPRLFYHQFAQAPNFGEDIGVGDNPFLPVDLDPIPERD